MEDNHGICIFYVSSWGPFCDPNKHLLHPPTLLLHFFNARYYDSLVCGSMGRSLTFCPLCVCATFIPDPGAVQVTVQLRLLRAPSSSRTTPCSSSSPTPSWTQLCLPSGTSLGSPRHVSGKETRRVSWWKYLREINMHLFNHEYKHYKVPIHLTKLATFTPMVQCLLTRKKNRSLNDSQWPNH